VKSEGYKWSKGREIMKRERLLIIYYFSIGLYSAVLFGLGFALFNVEVGADKLPIVYVIFPFLDALTAYVMARVITKKGLKVFFKRFIVAVILVHILLLPMMFQYISMRVTYGLMLVLLIAISENLLFTRTYLVQEVFTLEELRKWVPIAISFGAVGALIGGAFLRLSEGLFASGFLFLFIFPVLLVIGYTSNQLLLTVGSANREIFSKRMVTIKSIWSYTTGQAFLPLLIGCVALIAITDTINEYLFHFHSTSALNNLEQLTGFLGVFLTLRYGTELILNLFLYNKLMKRMGSINLMPFLLSLAAISLIVVSFASQGLYLALVGRVLSIVAVIGFLMYLLEVFYQLLDPIYRPALVTIVGYIDAFSGYAIGGSVLLLHTVGGIPVKFIVGLLAIVLVALAFLWIRNKRGFIDVLNASQSAELSGSVEDIIGSGGSENMLAALMKNAEFGSRSERLFLLYVIKNQSVEGQKVWLNQLFNISEMEIRVTILEHIFESRIFGFDPVLHAHELNVDFKNWLVEKCFVNYPQMKEQLLFGKLQGALTDTEPVDEAVGLMMKYMFEDTRMVYGKILSSISDRKRLEGEALIDSIIESYKGIEDNAHLMWFDQGHLSAPHIMAHYDEELGYAAIHSYVKNTNYPLLNQVVTAYEEDMITTQLLSDDMSIMEMLYVAEAGRRHKNTYDYYDNTLKALYYIRSREMEMDHSHDSAHFLKYELDQLRIAIEAVLVDQTLDRSHISLTGRSYEYLSNDRKRPVLIEMIRGLKRDKWTECLMSLLEGQELTCHFIKQEFKIGDSGDWIETLIKYNRGDEMEDDRKKEIDFMIALKSVPMFETLDIDTLKKLTEIVTVGHLNSGDTIVRKGQRGSKFFVLLRGQAAVYLNEKDAPIAIIPEGQMIGELGVLNNDLRTATVKADGPIQLLSMEGDAFLELIQRNTAISLAVIHTLSERLTGMLKARERSS